MSLSLRKGRYESGLKADIVEIEGVVGGGGAEGNGEGWE